MMALFQKINFADRTQRISYISGIIICYTLVLSGISERSFDYDGRTILLQDILDLTFAAVYFTAPIANHMRLKNKSAQQIKITDVDTYSPLLIFAAIFAVQWITSYSIFKLHIQ